MKFHNVLKKCLKTPDFKVKYVTSDYQNIDDVIFPTIILEMENHNTFITHKDNVLTFKNGSVIELAGSDDSESIQSLRGGHVNLCVLDNSNSCIDKNYIINSILKPTLCKLNGELIINE